MVYWYWLMVTETNFMKVAGTLSPSQKNRQYSYGTQCPLKGRNSQLKQISGETASGARGWLVTFASRVEDLFPSEIENRHCCKNGGLLCKICSFTIALLWWTEALPVTNDISRISFSIERVTASTKRNAWPDHPSNKGWAQIPWESMSGNRQQTRWYKNWVGENGTKNWPEQSRTIRYSWDRNNIKAMSPKIPQDIFSTRWISTNMPSTALSEPSKLNTTKHGKQRRTWLSSVFSLKNIACSIRKPQPTFSRWSKALRVRNECTGGFLMEVLFLPRDANLAAWDG